MGTPIPYFSSAAYKKSFYEPFTSNVGISQKILPLFSHLFFLKTHLTTSSIIQGGNQPSVSASSTTQNSFVVEFYISLL